ncbi:MAG: MgtC/SapB family protein [Treponema sp.]|nr:MgtC/SapB family protein [Treponema sp.]
MDIQIEYFIRIGLSFVCSFVLGLERKSHQHTVGIRTLVLMGLSSCLLSILSVHMAEFPAVKGDPTRIAAGVITGIGFLGGGAILKLGLNIRGLTTAAIIFTTSAIGMSFGAGLYLPPVVIFVIVMIILLTMDKFEKKFFPAAKTKVVVIKFTIDENAEDYNQKSKDIMVGYGFIVHDVNSKYLPKENLMELDYTVKTPDKLDAMKIAREFGSKFNKLESFVIIDK